MPAKASTQIESLPERGAPEIRWPIVLHIDTVVRLTPVVDLPVRSYSRPIRRRPRTS